MFPDYPTKWWMSTRADGHTCLSHAEQATLDTTFAALRPEVALYMRKFADARAEYGPKTVLLMQMGSFFEIYGVQSDDGQHVLGNIAEACQIMLINTSFKYENVLMAGFQPPSLDKYGSALIRAGYTLCVIPQELDKVVNGKAVYKRDEWTVYSTSFALINDASDKDRSNRFLTTILLRVHDRMTVHAGVAAMDTQTGEVLTAQLQCAYTWDGTHAALQLDELCQFVDSYIPSEVVLYVLADQADQLPSPGDMTNQLGLAIEPKTFAMSTAEFNRFSAPDAQDQVFGTVYPEAARSMLKPRDNLGLADAPDAAFALVRLFLFAQKHALQHTKNLRQPQAWFDKTHCLLANDALRQLNIVPYDTARPKECLFALLNQCQTVMGARLLRRRLMRPIVQPDELERRYSTITTFVENEALAGAVRNHLCGLLDMENIVRRFALLTANQEDVRALYVQLFSARDILKDLKAAGCLHLFVQGTDFENGFATLFEAWERVFDWGRVNCKQKSECPHPLFRPGFVPSLDAKLSTMMTSWDRMMAWQDEAVAILKSEQKRPPRFNADMVCLLPLDDARSTYGLCATATRAEAVAKSWNAPVKLLALSCGREIKPAEDRGGHTTVHRPKTNSKDAYLEFPALTQTSRQFVAARTKFVKEYNDMLNEQIEYFATVHAAALAATSRFLAEVDAAVSFAQIAAAYGYTRPCIGPLTGPPTGKTDEAYVAYEGLRHPIIERRTNQRTPYVPHTVALGCDSSSASSSASSSDSYASSSDNTHTGILLYGMNASGKSSLMKAVGIGIIMAQAGLFVPASSMRFTPFRHVFTRIHGNDNIFRGLSSYTVEMTELRAIFERATEHSLVLGDELCAGTETDSATAIVASSIEHLCKRRTKFVIATHLHELCTYPEFQDMCGLAIRHLVVKEEHGRLTYERTLSEGSGPATYGLLVAQALGLPAAIMARAEAYHKALARGPTGPSGPSGPSGPEGPGALARPSRYNRSVFKDQCALCKGTDNLITHHIVPQSLADKHGRIGPMHKNTASNLVVICHDCHEKEHTGEGVHIEGWTDTSDGPQLRVAAAAAATAEATVEADTEPAVTASGKRICKVGPTEAAYIRTVQAEHPHWKPRQIVRAYNERFPGVKITAAKVEAVLSDISLFC
jgi:DNA mismatch repair protein MutS